jgi:hypothetical protein
MLSNIKQDRETMLTNDYDAIKGKKIVEFTMNLKKLSGIHIDGSFKTRFDVNFSARLI